MNDLPQLLGLISQDTAAIIGFILLLGILLLILFRGESRGEPSVIANDPPHFPDSSPYHDSNRRKAAAAAAVVHRFTSKGNPS